MKYTILVVTYNKEKYIEKCLNSIFNQTYKNFELIVVDDGSVDNTKEIIKKYQKKYKFKYYYKKNTGVADTRNYAISKVKTKYFMFVDSDDYISENVLQKCNEYDNYDLLCFKGYKVTEDYNIIEKLEKEGFIDYDGKKALLSFIKSNILFLVPWGYMYNINVFKKNNLKYEKHYVMEDVGLTPIVILNSKKVISIDLYGYYYVQSKESIMRTKKQNKVSLKTKSILFHVDNLNKYISKNIKEKKLKKEYYSYFSRFLIWYGTQLEKNFLDKYIEQLKKRKILKKLKNYDIVGTIKKVLCIINYKMYYKLYKRINNKGEKI